MRLASFWRMLVRVQWTHSQPAQRSINAALHERPPCLGVPIAANFKALFRLPLRSSRPDAFGRGDVSVLGGEFTGCRSTGNGAFMFASDGAVVTVTGGTVTNSVAQRRAGVVSNRLKVYLLGPGRSRMFTQS